MDDELTEIDPSDEIENPKLRRLVMRVALTTRLAAEKAIAHLAEPSTYPLPDDPKSLEGIFFARFRQYRPEQRQLAIAKFLPRVKAAETERVKVYGDLTRVSLRQPTPVATQARALPLPADVRFTSGELRQVVLGRPIFSPALAAAVASLGERSEEPPPSRPERDKLQLRLHRVRCVEETGNWFVEVFGGADEIDLGGVAVDETGDTRRITPFRVGEFEEGDVRRYEPPRQFVRFNLREGGQDWPKDYYITLVLAEVDFGGVGEFIGDLYEKVKTEVEAALSAAGAAFGPIGAAVAWVIGKVIGWILEALGDEVFPPRTVHARIGSLTSRFRDGRVLSDGSAVSPTNTIKFIGHEGEYRLEYSWRKFD
ncbi:MAG TPA: hypothetical protein VHS99_23125 [Chloroflexota bacterium]|nr:hypothetical protein [Chloroflexota bacterium]